MPNETEQIFAGKNFVITGSLIHFANRNELKAKIEEKGGKVTGSVDYLGMEQDPCDIHHASVLGRTGRALLSLRNPETLTKRKLSGVYTQKALDKRVPLLRSF